MQDKKTDAISAIQALSDKIMAEAYQTGDKSLGLIAFTLSLYRASAFTGDLPEFLMYTMDFIDKKTNKEVPVPAGLLLITPSQLN